VGTSNLIMVILIICCFQSGIHVSLAESIGAEHRTIIVKSARYSGYPLKLLELVDKLFDLGLVGPGKLFHFAAVLEEDEGRHRRHGVLDSDFLVLVHVNLEEDHLILELLGHLLQHGSDHLAGPTPSGKEVHDHQLGTGGGKLCGEVFLVGNGVNHDSGGGDAASGLVKGQLKHSPAPEGEAAAR